MKIVNMSVWRECVVLMCVTQVVMAASPVFHWGFDAPLGATERDQTEQGHTAVLKKGHHQHPAPSRVPDAGCIGGAVRIESRSIVEAATPHPLGDSWTLSWWWKQDELKRMGQGMKLPDVVVQFPDLQPDVVQVVIKDLGILQAKRVTPTGWENYVLVVEPGVAKLYLNGVLSAEIKKEGWVYSHKGGSLHFGATNWHRMYQGLLDEVWLFSGVLDSENIQELANETYHPEAEWLTVFDAEMQKLIDAGKLSNKDALYYQEIGAPSRKELLNTFKKSDSIEVRGDAAWALGVLEVDDALPELLKSLPSADTELGIRICDGLGEMGNTAAVDALTVAACSESSELRFAASVALTKLGESGYEALRQLLMDPRWDVVMSVANALAQTDWEPGTEADAATYFAVQNNWRAVDELGAVAAPALVGMLVMTDDEESAKNRNKEIIIDRRRKNSKEALVKLGVASEPALLAALISTRNDLVIASCDVLTETGTDAAVPSLTALLQNEDPAVVQVAAEALVPRRAESSIPNLLVLLTNESSGVRDAAGDALVTIGEPAFGATLPMLASPDAKSRKVAADVIGQIGNQAGIKPLTNLLKDSSWQVRVSAVEGLGCIGGDEVVLPLKQAMEDSDWVVRSMAVKSLAGLNSDVANSIITEALKDENSVVRYTARRALNGDFAVEQVSPLEAVEEVRIPTAPAGEGFVQPKVGELKLSTGSVTETEIVLPWSDATLQGDSIRLDGQAVAHWLPTDVCHWRFKVVKPGNYQVKVSQSAIESFAGAEYQVVVNGKKLPAKTEVTAGWGDFELVSVGMVSFKKPGEYALSIVPIRAVKWVMNLNEVRLVREVK